jgi:hypothetical protein
MTKITQKQIRNLVSFYKNSAYAQTDEIIGLAYDLFEAENGYTANCDEEREQVEALEEVIFNAIEEILEGYEYIECENQGSYRRHIWHKIKE